MHTQITNFLSAITPNVTSSRVTTCVDQMWKVTDSQSRHVSLDNWILLMYRRGHGVLIHVDDNGVYTKLCFS